MGRITVLKSKNAERPFYRGYLLGSLCIVFIPFISMDYKCSAANSEDQNKITAQIYLERGNKLLEEGNYDGAMRNFNSAIEINPDIAEAYRQRGNILIKRGLFDSAIRDYNSALKFDPNDVKAYNNRGLAFFNKDEFEKAFLDFTRALEINPDYALAYLNRGMSLYEKGDHDQAINDFTEFINLNPGIQKLLIKALTHRGFSYSFRGVSVKRGEKIAEGMGLQVERIL